MTVNDENIKLKLDSGAQCNVMPRSSFVKLTTDNIRKSRTKLVSFSGHKINVVGKGTLLVQHKGKYFPVEFQLVDRDDLTPIIGLSTCLEMNLIKRVHEVTAAANKAEIKDHSNTDKILGEYQGVSVKR